MIKRLSIGVIALALLASLFAQPSPAHTTQIETFAISYLQQLFNRWNAKQLILQKIELTPVYNRRIDLRVRLAPLGYENQNWRKNALQYWSLLPKTVKPQKPLTQGAQRLLLQVLKRNLPTYLTFMQKNYGRTTDLKDRIRSDLNASFFIVVYEGQRLSVTRSIDEAAIRKRLASSKSQEWPECMPKQQPPK